MTLLRCSSAIRDHIKIPFDQLEYRARRPRATLIGAWHVDVIRLEETDFVIFINGPTLLSFLVGSITPATFKDPANLTQLFLNGLLDLLVREEVPIQKILDVSVAQSPFAFDSTSDYDQSMIEVIQDVMLSYKKLVAEAGRLTAEKLVQIVRSVNRIPRTIDGTSSPLEAWGALMERVSEPESHQDQQMFMLMLYQRLRREQWVEISPAEMKNRISRIFPTIEEFTVTCDEFKIEYKFSRGPTLRESTLKTTNAWDGVVIQLRLYDSASPLGMPLPGRN